MKKKEIIQIFFYSIFLISIMCVDMAYKDLWSIGSYVRIINLFLLILFSYLSFRSVLKPQSINLVKFYTLPIILFIIGFIINLIFSSLNDLSMLTQIGNIYTWIIKLNRKLILCLKL